MTQNRREQLRKEEQAKANQQRLTRIIAVGAGLVVLVIVAVFAVVLISGANKGTAGTPVAGQITPPNALAQDAGIRPYPGTAKDGVPVVELFFDYQCPICNQFETIYGAALEKLASSGQIDLHYRPMIFLDGNLQNDASLRAAVGAACADVAGKYREYHDQIFANQPQQEGAGYPDSVLRDAIPAKLGITGGQLTTFQKCYDDKQTQTWVQAQDEAGAKAGVTGTPTFKVNGKDVSLKEFANVSPEQLGDLVKKYEAAR
jgi:protein-disulfide isomerase